jgi:xanthine dehydrogenase large subunit
MKSFINFLPSTWRRHSVTPNAVKIRATIPLQLTDTPIEANISYDPPIIGKWLQLLKEIAPRTTRVAAVLNPDTAFHPSFISAEIEAASSFGVRAMLAPVRDRVEIEDAIAAGSFLTDGERLHRGDAEGALRDAPHRLDGELHIGGQEHFYLETNAALAYRDHDGGLMVHSSTQHPSETQEIVARVLGLPKHAVVVQCLRMGGAFGGKETQAVIPAFLAALVAQKTNRAARVVYTKHEDLLRTGKRHPYRCFWKVGFNEDVQILCARLEFYSNGGCSTDLSLAVLERTILHADNAYFIPDIDIRGRVCRTNLPSNTAFRGFGAPQAVAVMENILQEVAISLRKDAYEVRRRNCYGSGKRRVTPYGQIVEGNSLPRIFRQLAKTADYKARLAEIAKFNGTSKSSLRGIAITAVKFGISFTKKFLNQANAMVNVYTDGTVQVSTGATEMGQGVHTKIRQLVADEFGIGVDSVSVMLTSTEKSNNTSPTAASGITSCVGSQPDSVAAGATTVIGPVQAGLFTLSFVGPQVIPGQVNAIPHVPTNMMAKCTGSARAKTALPTISARIAKPTFNAAK